MLAGSAFSVLVLCWPAVAARQPRGHGVAVSAGVGAAELGEPDLFLFQLVLAVAEFVGVLVDQVVLADLLPRRGDHEHPRIVEVGDVAGASRMLAHVDAVTVLAEAGQPHRRAAVVGRVDEGDSLAGEGVGGGLAAGLLVAAVPEALRGVLELAHGHGSAQGGERVLVPVELGEHRSVGDAQLGVGQRGVRGGGLGHGQGRVDLGPPGFGAFRDLGGTDTERGELVDSGDPVAAGQAGAVLVLCPLRQDPPDLRGVVLPCPGFRGGVDDHDGHRGEPGLGGGGGAPVPVEHGEGAFGVAAGHDGHEHPVVFDRGQERRVKVGAAANVRSQRQVGRVDRDQLGCGCVVHWDVLLH